MKKMRFSNPIYTRTWMKVFAPIGILFASIGKQWHFQTLIGDKNTDEYVLPMSNGHTHHDTDDESSSSSHSTRHPLRTFFSALVSPFRPVNALLSSAYGQRNAHDNHLKSSRQQRFSEKNFIYHQIPMETINDENNNNTQTSLNGNSSTTIHLPSVQSSHQQSTDLSSFTRDHLLALLIFSLIYFSWFIFFAGFTGVHVLLYSIMLFLYVLSDRTRRVLLAVLIYLFYLLLYDALHLVPNYSISKVHIRDVYLTEKKLFGVFSNGHLMTLNEYFRANHRPFLDIFTGFCYLNWIPIPVGYSFYLYRYKSKRDYMDFALTFLLTNMLGFVIYYIIPAAPPWYIELYGFNMNMKAPGSPAGFIHFDQITGIKLFSSMYSKNANVFAAIPSLHAAYPLITVLYGSLSKKLWLHIGFVLFTLSVWFSAVYSRHHYVLDVLAGGTCAVTAFVLYRLLSRIPTINRLLTAYSKVI